MLCLAKNKQILRHSENYLNGRRSENRRVSAMWTGKLQAPYHRGCKRPRRAALAASPLSACSSALTCWNEKKAHTRVYHLDSLELIRSSCGLLGSRVTRIFKILVIHVQERRLHFRHVLVNSAKITITISSQEHSRKCLSCLHITSDVLRDEIHVRACLEVHVSKAINPEEELRPRA